MKDNFFPDFNAYCDKCKRYFNPKTPHVCFPEDMAVEDERRKLKRWLKDYETIE